MPPLPPITQAAVVEPVVAASEVGAPSPSPWWRAQPGRPGRTLRVAYPGADARDEYLLHVPDRAAETDAPLVVMLHGGGQTAAEFASATGMRQLADEFGCLVAFPQQSRIANPGRFWNWFSPDHQRAGTGEPALIAAIIRQIVNSFGTDPRRVYIAGFSAGGAMAAVMSATYPDMFAAAAVHSGLPYRSAHDTVSASRAMQHGGSQVSAGSSAPPLLVIHGDADQIVSPVNANALIAARLAGVAAVESTQEHLPAAGRSRAVDRTVHRRADGTTVAELWIYRGGGHDWFGGQPAPAYADPRGPSASEAIITFFAAH